LARRDLVGALDLRDRAVDRIFDQLFVAVAAGPCFIDLGDDASLGVIAVRIDRRNRADAAGRGPGAGACMVRRADALAAFDQRPDLASAIEDGLQPLEQSLSPSSSLYRRELANCSLILAHPGLKRAGDRSPALRAQPI